MSDQLRYHLEKAGLIKDRRYRLRTILKCFVGSEVVEWLKEHAGTLRSEAIDILNYLLFKDFIYRVSEGSRGFEAGQAFYRFRADDQAPEQSCGKVTRSPRRLTHMPQVGSSTPSCSSPFGSTTSDSYMQDRDTEGIKSPTLRSIGRSWEIGPPPNSPSSCSRSLAHSPFSPSPSTQLEPSAVSRTEGDSPSTTTKSQPMLRASVGSNAPEDCVFSADEERPPSILVRSLSTTSTCSRGSITSYASVSALQQEDRGSQQPIRDYAMELRRAWIEAGLIKDHRFRLHVYNDSFLASDVLTWMTNEKQCFDSFERQEAIDLLQLIEELDIIHHVTDSHRFNDSSHVYRFRVDDDTELPEITSDTLALGEAVYKRAWESQPPIVSNRSYRGKSYPSCFVAREFVDSLLSWKLFSCREEAVIFGRQLVIAGAMHHVCNDHHFKDAYLFFRFSCDDMKESGNVSSSGKLAYLSKSTRKLNLKLRKRATSLSQPQQSRLPLVHRLTNSCSEVREGRQGSLFFAPGTPSSATPPSPENRGLGSPRYSLQVERTTHSLPARTQAAEDIHAAPMSPDDRARRGSDTGSATSSRSRSRALSRGRSLSDTGISCSVQEEQSPDQDGVLPGRTVPSDSGIFV